MCSDVFDNVIKGSKDANNYSFVRIAFERCKKITGAGAQECASKEDQEIFLRKHNYVQFIFRNMYPNTSEAKPMKEYTSTNDFISLDDRRTKNASYRITPGDYNYNVWKWEPGQGS